MRTLGINILFYTLGMTPFVLTAQNSPWDGLRISAHLHRGYALPEYQFVNYLLEDYVHSADLTISKRTTGDHFWEQLFRYPEYGVSVFHSSLGNHVVFGNEWAFTAFFKYYFAGKGRWEMYNRTGLGLGYATRKFNPENNFLNVAVGSHWNIHLNLRVGMRYQLAERWNLDGGISFDHYSNGNTSEPNLGVNYLTAYTGLGYRIGNKKERQTPGIPVHEPTYYGELFLSGGGKFSRALVDVFYKTASLSADYYRTMSHAFHLGVGADLFYDSSVIPQLQGREQQHRSSDAYQSGVHFTIAFVYNQLSLMLQQGIYLGLREKAEGYALYNRGVIRYAINDQWRVRLSMKSHLHILDYPEIGIGWAW